METSGSENPEIINPTLSAISNDLAAAVEHAGRVVVAINARRRIPSSGVIWREGAVVTADHTIKREEEILVMLPDGRAVTAALAGRDPGTDLALLKLDVADLPVAKTVDATSLKTGHMVLAIGRAGERGTSASLGVISVLGGPWRTWRGGQIDQYVRPDVALYPGFSGGPLVDIQGGIVGINTSALSRHGGLTIPASTVNRVVDELLAKGHIARAYIGVGMYPVRLPKAFKDRLGIKPGHGGVIIISVEPDSPADLAGLLIGDIVIALDGVPVSDTDDVQAVLGPERVGKSLKVSIIRGGELITLEITVGERPRRRK